MWKYHHIQGFVFFLSVKFATSWLASLSGDCKLDEPVNLILAETFGPASHTAN